MLVSGFRVTKFAFQNFWRNFWLSLITVSMLVLTLITINILVVLNVVTDKAISLVEDRIEVSVYFEEYTEDTTVTRAVSYMRGLSQVRDVEIVTADEAYEAFVLRHADDAEIMNSLQELGDNPFGPMLVVKTESADDFELVIAALDNPEFSDFIREKDFSDYQEIVTRIRSTTDQIRLVGVGLSLIFLFVAILIIYNTVRIGIFIHREEIGIMRLVGASNWFIKAPFYLEMIFLCLVSVVAAAVVVWPMISFVEPRLVAYFATEHVGVIEYFQINGLTIFGVELGILILITLFSTAGAMRKYLRV
ncbi:MAG: permease-like cell division protein FtsX [bacterium]|jgi:cell division transport system permease protein|nr:permease-like cell division protein FtsX [bacterium]